MLKYVNTRIVFLEIPREITLAIELSNCPNKCKGCHSPELQQDIGTELTIEKLDNIISSYMPGITCVCFMGGDNDISLRLTFAKHIHSKYHNRVKVACYSGNDNLPEMSHLKSFDYYKYGHYDEKSGPLDSKTTNQKLLKYNKRTDSIEDITYEFWNKI